MEPLATQFARTNKKYKSAIDPKNADAHAIIDDETMKLTAFSSGDSFWLLLEVVMALNVFLTFSQNKCLSCLKKSSVKDLY